MVFFKYASWCLTWVYLKYIELFILQVVTGPQLEILDIVVRYPGSTHDITIFERSALRARFEHGETWSSTGE